MSTHIGRLEKIGLGKETTAGTAVSATAWLPKTGGSFTPKFETVFDEASHGTIDGTREGFTAKAYTDVTLQGEMRDDWSGHLLMGAFGLAYPCVRFPISGGSGTFVEGETVTESTSSATGTLRRTDAGAGTPCLYIEPVSGTFTGGQTLTGGTSGATATGGTIQSPSAVRHHIFRNKNTNNKPSYTIVASDPLEDVRSTYAMLDTLDIEVLAADFAKFNARFMGKQQESTSATPSFTAGNPFIGKFASVKAASAFTGLDAASAISVERMKISIANNLTDFHALGSVSPASIHNQRFDIKGDMTLLYNATTQRDYLVNSTKRALRLSIPHTGVTIGASANPTLQIDLPVCTFTEWSATDDNDGLVRQTVSFTAEYDLTRAMTGEAMLVNTRTTAY